jgi:hypothetical protein
LANFLSIYPKRVDDLGNGKSIAGSPSVSGSDASSLASGGYIKLVKRQAEVHSSKHEIEVCYSNKKTFKRYLLNIFRMFFMKGQM